MIGKKGRNQTIWSNSEFHVKQLMYLLNASVKSIALAWQIKVVKMKYKLDKLVSSSVAHITKLIRILYLNTVLGRQVIVLVLRSD